MEQVNKKRGRVSWKDINVEKTFIEACLQEISINGREGSSLKPLSWKKVAQVLKETHKFEVDRKQMTNHLSYLKGKYQAWLKLGNKTGNVYDSSTNTFNLTDEEWELEIKANKYVESLRTTQLLYPELCAQLFEGVVATGIRGHGPNSTVPMPEVLVVELPLEEEVEQQQLPLEEEVEQQQVNSTPNDSSRPQVKRNKRKGNESMTAFEEKIVGVLTLMAEKYASHHSPTVDECLAKLDELGWESQDSLYDAALAIFSEDSQSNKVLWMKLKPERCENWVKNLARAKGMLV